MTQRKTSVFREKCNRARLSRSPSEICGRHSGAGTDFPHQYYSTKAADQCSFASGLSKRGCRPNSKYSLTYLVTLFHSPPSVHYVQIFPCGNMQGHKILMLNFAGCFGCTVK